MAHFGLFSVGHRHESVEISDVQKVTLFMYYVKYLNMKVNKN